MADKPAARLDIAIREAVNDWTLSQRGGALDPAEALSALAMVAADIITERAELADQVRLAAGFDASFDLCRETLHAQKHPGTPGGRAADPSQTQH